jgi:hypothetical protein
MALNLTLEEQSCIKGVVLKNVCPWTKLLNVLTRKLLLPLQKGRKRAVTRIMHVEILSKLQIVGRGLERREQVSGREECWHTVGVGLRAGLLGRNSG